MLCWCSLFHILANKVRNWLTMYRISKNFCCVALEIAKLFSLVFNLRSQQWFGLFIELQKSNSRQIQIPLSGKRTRAGPGSHQLLILEQNNKQKSTLGSVLAWISLNVFTLMVGAFKARQQNQDWDVASDRMNRLTSHAANNHIMKNTNPHHFSNEQLFARIIILSFSGIAEAGQRGSRSGENLQHFEKLHKMHHLDFYNVDFQNL